MAKIYKARFQAFVLFCLAIHSAPLTAHGREAGGDEGRRIRIALGPELTPAYPGADRMSLSPFFDFGIARQGDEFAYEAPDESFGFPIISAGGIHLGPTLAVTDARKIHDSMNGLRAIDTTFEVGLSVEADITSQLYFYAEFRRGLGGHDAWTGQAGLDYILRNGDGWLLSAGPRLTWGDRRHTRSYFGISPTESADTGLSAYDPSGGIQSAGAVIGGLYQLNQRWGLAAYGGYSRLVGNAADSPIVRRFGNRNQWSTGLALSYTFRR